MVASFQVHSQSNILVKEKTLDCLNCIKLFWKEKNSLKDYNYL